MSTYVDEQTRDEIVEAALAPLHRRRSSQGLTGPGPDDATVAALIEAACTAPDHGMLRPYRFVVVRDGGLAALADALVAGARERKPDLPPPVEAKLRGKTTAAPVMVVLIASPVADHKVPEWEQLVTAGCAGYGLALAADLAGVGAVWKSAPVLDGQALASLLHLTAGEQLLGWINLGTATSCAVPRVRTPAASVTARLEGADLSTWDPTA